MAQNQRERLFAATVAIAAEKGYEAMTVADLLDLSGVSRSAFYAHFANKGECLLAAASELIQPAVDALAPTDGEGVPRRPREIFAEFFTLLDTQSAAARVCFVELHAAGPEGDALCDRAFEALAEAVEEHGDQTGAGRTHQELTRALLGGLRKLIHSRLARGNTQLASDAPELWRWLTSVVPPPGALAVPRRQRASGSGMRPEGYTPAEKIARAVTALVAENGYRQLSTDEIATRASISLSTFYEHFTDKHDAVLWALEIGGAQVTAQAVPVARRAGGWEEGVRALYEAMCTYFAAEPALARLAMVGVYSAGPRALARRDRVIDSLAEMLAPGFEKNPEAPEISAEAIAATVYALMREQVRRSGAESLGAVVPLATYVSLVTFVGPERALEVANGERAVNGGR